MSERLPKSATDIVEHILHKVKQDTDFLTTLTDDEIQIVQISILAIRFHENVQMLEHNHLFKLLQQQTKFRKAKFEEQSLLETISQLLWSKKKPLKKQNELRSSNKRQSQFQQQNADSQPGNMNPKNQKKQCLKKEKKT